jgi:fucose permease
LGWRAALLVALLALALVTVVGRRLVVPQAGPSLTPATQCRRLPGMFWALWTVLLLTVAMEWSVVGWGTNLLATTGGLDLNLAAPLFSLYFAGGAVGRYVNSRWALHVSARHLLLGMLAVVAIGLPLFWLASSVWLRLVGLVTLGFGISSLFPLGLGAALNVADDQSDAASSRVTLAAGTAMLLAPFTLGWLADHYGLQRAFGIVAVFLVAAVAVTLTIHRILAVRRTADAASRPELLRVARST